MTPPSIPPPPEADPDSPLRDYLRAKQDVVDLLRDLQRLVGRVTPWASGRVDDLVRRLAEDRFQLVVLGQFKRGKTSLMNAIVGQAILPTGTVPVTSVVTSLRFGPSLRARVKRAGFPTIEVPIDQLPAYITERGNPGNKKRVLAATIDVPTPFLRRGLHFIDTPGIGSAHEHNTAATMAFLPEADAAILVTGADAPMSDAELTFLDAVRQHVRKLFFVLNKVDQVSEIERAEVERYTTQLLTRRLGVEAVKLFSVSAAEALAAGPDQARRERSGLPALEAALASFLNDERRVVFLVALLDRAVAVVDEAGYLLGLRQRALNETGVPAGAAPAEVIARWHEVEQARRAAIARVAERFERWYGEALDPSLRDFTEATTRALETAVPGIVAGGPAAHGTTLGDWLTTEVRRHGEAWLEAFTPRVDAVAREAIAQASPEIGRLVAEIEAAVVSRYGDATGALGGQAARDWVWGPPPFALPDGPWDVTAAPPPGDRRHAWLPRVLDDRRLVRSLLGQVPVEVARLVAVLRGVVGGHLESCVVGLDVASASQLAGERRRFEQVFVQRTDEAARAPADADGAAQLAGLRSRLVALRVTLLGHVAPADAAVAEVVAPAPDEVEAAPRPEAPPPALQSDTCPICAAASDAVFAVLCHHQFAINTSTSARRAFLAARGLCAPHTWHLERVTSPRGLCLAYPPLLDDVAGRLEAMAGLAGEGLLRRFGELLAHDQSCPACNAQHEAEHAGAARLVECLRRADGRAEFERALGLCLPHLRLVVAGLEAADAQWLLRAHARRFVALGEAMRDYALKHDAGRRSQLTEDQMHACRRALVLLAGERYLHRTDLEE